ncbi:hypothetical protein AJ79_02578 [Helicocarpus griseus UAMH5409]|uniref:Uncharacterized protein n=1 Tax=Helicocarpus griseus UAMH5409 TaxID=1447875 RepID=A0A2B7Y2E3_9EURO|nr:hypothetical protein AJ79_02578 [Helicocarpus griseus UAMH5409]
MEYLLKKYGRKNPIRIQPNLLLFAHPSALKEIYWDPKCNTKSSIYGSGVFVPPHIFSTKDGEKHRELRKALGGAPWTIGSLKNNWEARFDDHILLLCNKLTENAKAGELILLGERVAQFATDVLTMLAFTEPFGFVKNARDEHRILETWRQSLGAFSFFSRLTLFHRYIGGMPGMGKLLFPPKTDIDGAGWVLGEAERQVNNGLRLMEKHQQPEKPDFLQHCLDARFDDKTPLSQAQREAQMVLLMQAGTDTTGTALGSTMRFLLTHPEKLERARREIESAEQAGLLSDVIKYEETRQHLPYIVASIKETLRLEPPATNLFGRVAPKEGKTIGEHYIPPGAEITTLAWIVQRDPETFGPDRLLFRPERWLDKTKAAEFESAIFNFGIGPRTCLGREVAYMELYKLVPELIRRFDYDLQDAGEFVIRGGISYNKDLTARLTPRT